MLSFGISRKGDYLCGNGRIYGTGHFILLGMQI